MSQDPSKITYCCTRCNTLPCRCVKEYKPLEHTTFPCKVGYCNFIGYTANQLAEHRLDKHSTKLVPTFTTNGVRYE